MEHYTYTKLQCFKCNKRIGINNWSRHIKKCPGTKTCPVCSKKFIGSKPNQKTCSYACSNRFFRSGENNGQWKDDAYRSTCFKHHEKKCIVCGEDKIVAVHHLNENKKDNSPENLIPLCPTHHAYVHSRYKDEVLPYLDKYVEAWKTKRELA